MVSCTFSSSTGSGACKKWQIIADTYIPPPPTPSEADEEAGELERHDEAREPVPEEPEAEAPEEGEIRGLAGERAPRARADAFEEQQRGEVHHSNLATPS